MNINKLIEEQGISKLKLALECNIPPHHLYNAINGKTPFYPKYKQSIAEYFNLTQQELFKEDNECTKSN